jgi:hypothetical protein
VLIVTRTLTSDASLSVSVLCTTSINRAIYTLYHAVCVRSVCFCVAVMQQAGASSCGSPRRFHRLHAIQLLPLPGFLCFFFLGVCCSAVSDVPAEDSTSGGVLSDLSEFGIANVGDSIFIFGGREGREPCPSGQFEALPALFLTHHTHHRPHPHPSTILATVRIEQL